MEPFLWGTARTRWLGLTPPASRSTRGHPDLRGRFPEEHRLPLRPAPPYGLRWGSVPAAALPETQKGQADKRNKPVSEPTRNDCDAKINPTGHFTCYEKRTSSRATDSNVLFVQPVSKLTNRFRILISIPEADKGIFEIAD